MSDLLAIIFHQPPSQNMRWLINIHLHNNTILNIYFISSFINLIQYTTCCKRVQNYIQSGHQLLDSTIIIGHQLFRRISSCWTSMRLVHQDYEGLSWTFSMLDIYLSWTSSMYRKVQTVCTLFYFNNNYKILQKQYFFQ